MNFFIVDDSAIVRAMLASIVEEDELGMVVGEASDGSEVYADQLIEQQIDILLIDLLMPNRSGLETTREIAPYFPGKIIIISQVESKELIGEAYSMGVEYYITKPINRLEVASVLKKVRDCQLMEKSLFTIQKSLGSLHESLPSKAEPATPYRRCTRNAIVNVGKRLLLELGIIGEKGNKDLLDILYLLDKSEKEGNRKMPPLKKLYEQVARFRLGATITEEEMKKGSKACEQRIRRSVQQALEHIASLGLTEHSNHKFEKYASNFFDYNQVREKMLELEGKQVEGSYAQVNIKKFILAFYMAAKQTLN